jgi:flagellar motility protein MotE (MotC chaperone)
MRWIRAAVLASIAFKVVVLGGYWGGVALAERAAGEPVTADDGQLPPELFRKSRGFRTLLEAARDRDEELERRAQELAARETAMKTLADLLGEQVSRLEVLTGTPPSAIAAAAGGEAGGPTEGTAGPCGVTLTKIYASMNPEQAGPLLDRLDDAVVKSILSCMKEKQVGAMLAAMSRDRAVAITRSLAGERDPEPPPPAPVTTPAATPAAAQPTPGPTAAAEPGNTPPPTTTPPPNTAPPPTKPTAKPPPTR